MVEIESKQDNYVISNKCDDLENDLKILSNQKIHQNAEFMVSWDDTSVIKEV